VSLIKLIRSIASRPRKRRFGWYPTNLSIAFLSMQIIAEPKIGHTIEQYFVMQDEEEDDNSGDPNDPIAHLHRQAKLIRNGIPIDRLTARLPPRPCAVSPSPASKR
jgi:hypothetical protein